MVITPTKAKWLAVTKIWSVGNLHTLRKRSRMFEQNYKYVRVKRWNNKVGLPKGENGSIQKDHSVVMITCCEGIWTQLVVLTMAIITYLSDEMAHLPMGTPRAIRLFVAYEPLFDPSSRPLVLSHISRRFLIKLLPWSLFVHSIFSNKIYSF